MNPINRLVGFTTAVLFLINNKMSPAEAGRAQDIATASNQFGLDLFKNFPTSVNNFISPYSISTALSMIYIGARGQTESAMAKGLHLSENKLSASDVASGYKDISGQLDGPKNYSLDVAKAAYVRKDFELNKDYSNTLTSDFKAKASSVDFATQGPQILEEINKFVNSATKGFIPKILEEPLSASTLLVLINAIFFKGNWTVQFDEEDTMDSTFGSGSKKCKLMYVKSKFQYTDSSDLNAQVLEMTYAGDEVSMVVVLPKDSQDLSTLLPKLTYANIQKAINSFKKQEVKAYFPRFTMETSYELNKDLSKIGMDIIFSEKADFSGISDQGGLQVSNVIHKAKIIVDEKGTTAAAATVVTMVRMASISTSETIFRADHPFVFLIRHIPTGLFLFLGGVFDPGYE